MSKYYNKQFKEEALKLSDEIGVKKAASQVTRYQGGVTNERRIY